MRYYEFTKPTKSGPWGPSLKPGFYSSEGVFTISIRLNYEADRIWDEDGLDVHYFKTPGLQRMVVDMAEFCWVKLSATPL